MILAVTTAEKTMINTSNCWEEVIEGVNTKTGNKAYYSKNFECKNFITNP